MLSLFTRLADWTTYDLLIEDKAAVLGVEVEIEKITDMASIMGYGVMSTPGVVMDGKVVHAGGIPQPDKVETWLRA